MHLEIVKRIDLKYSYCIKNGDHMENYQWGGNVGRMGEKVQGVRSIIGRYKIDRGWLRIV